MSYGGTGDSRDAWSDEGPISLAPNFPPPSPSVVQHDVVDWASTQTPSIDARLDLNESQTCPSLPLKTCKIEKDKLEDC